jgi:hypothetical protein
VRGSGPRPRTPTTAGPNRLDPGNATRYISLGLQFAVGAALGFYLGMKIDGWLGLPPVVFAPLLSLAAAGAALSGLIREVLRSGSPRNGSEREGAQKQDSDP